VVRYATVYPVAEGLAGVGMLAGLWTPLVGLTALVLFPELVTVLLD